MKNAGNVVEKTPKIVVTIIISITASNIGITDEVAVVEGVVDSDSQSVQTPSLSLCSNFPNIRLIYSIGNLVLGLSMLYFIK